MLREYIKLNYLEEESLCRMIFHQIYKACVLQVLHRGKHFLKLLPLMLKKMRPSKSHMPGLNSSLNIRTMTYHDPCLSLNKNSETGQYRSAIKNL